MQLTQHALDDLNEFSAHHLRLELWRPLESLNDSNWDGLPRTNRDENVAAADELEDAGLMLKLIPGEAGSSPQAMLEAHSPTLNVIYSPNQAPSTSSTSSPLASFLASQLQDIFAEEQAMIAHVLSNASGNLGVSSIGGGSGGCGSGGGLQASSSSQNDRDTHCSPLLAGEGAAEVARRITRAAKYAPTYHLTFSLFTPGASPSSWEIERALQEHLWPLLDAISSISNFTIDTQVQLYAKFSPSVREPQFDTVHQAWTLRREDLSAFINAAEWPLSPSIGGAPTLNFVLYVPSVEHAPLVIGENGGNSWLVPQWGGVVILNPSSSSSSVTSHGHLSIERLHDPLVIFSHQLLALLGAPNSPASLSLRLLTLTRLRCATLLLSASSTLGALARLTRALPFISIPSSVAVHVDQSIAHLALACSLLHHHHHHGDHRPSPSSSSPKLTEPEMQRGFSPSSSSSSSSQNGNPSGALKHARQAQQHAERAFFDNRMVGQVYFPDEHKIAVYLPLLGPIGVPLVVNGLKELKRLWAMR